MPAAGFAGWYSTYHKQYQNRWSTLFKSLKSNETTLLAFLSPFVAPQSAEYFVKQQQWTLERLPGCFKRNPNGLQSDRKTDVYPSQHQSKESFFETESEVFGCEEGCLQSSDDCVVAPMTRLQGLGTTDTSEAVGALDIRLSNKVSYDNVLFNECNMRQQVYFLDAASAIAAYSLEIQKDHVVLDLCSAPGGKAILIGSQLFGSNRFLFGDMHTPRAIELDASKGRLICNELSKERRKRLERNMRQRFPQRLFDSGKIQFTGVDAMDCKALERYAPFDNILIDAVCSADLHLLQQPHKGMSRWTLGTPKSNSQRQIQMVKSSMQLLKHGGTLLYCTCALSVLENDYVMEKTVKHFKGNIAVIPVFDEAAAERYSISVIPFTLEENKGQITAGNTTKRDWLIEETKFGVQLLPDKSYCGPLYICKLKKI